MADHFIFESGALYCVTLCMISRDVPLIGNLNTNETILHSLTTKAITLLSYLAWRRLLLSVRMTHELRSTILNKWITDGILVNGLLSN